MRILVTGAGRGGTSITKCVIKGLNIVDWYPRKKGEEDRNFFKYEALPRSYGTKLTIENEGFTFENLAETMERHNDLYIILALRHPVDNCMAKIVRGQKASDGGDSRVENCAPDATVEGAIAAVKKARSVHREIAKRFPGRIHIVKMEDLILYPKREVEKIVAFLGVRVTKEALEFYKYNTNRYQKRRYGVQLNTNQIGLHKKWHIAFNEFFKDRERDIRELEKCFKE